MAYLLEGKPKFDAADKQKWVSFENLLLMMEKLAEYYESEDQTGKAREERKKALQLIEIMENEAYSAYVDYFEKKLGVVTSKE